MDRNWFINLSTEDLTVVSNASCTTNCLAPLAKASGKSMLLVVIRSFTSGGFVSRRYFSSSVITCLCIYIHIYIYKHRDIYLYDDPNAFCLFAWSLCTRTRSWFRSSTTALALSRPVLAMRKVQWSCEGCGFVDGCFKLGIYGFVAHSWVLPVLQVCPTG